MLEAIDKSFSRMTPEDRNAIATYLLPSNRPASESVAAEALSNGQVDAVTNYVMQDIGHSQVHINTERVQALRAGGETSPLMLFSRIGTAAACVVLILALLWLRKKCAARRYNHSPPFRYGSEGFLVSLIR